MPKNLLSKEDTQVINAFLEVQKQHIEANKEWYHSFYLNGHQQLFSESFTLENFEANLKKIGWTIKLVEGYLSGFEYFRLLSTNVLPVINKVRSKDQILYAEFPDMIHDVIGHAPMLFNEAYTKFLKDIFCVISKTKQEALDIEYLRLQGKTQEHRERNLEAIEKIEGQLKETPTMFYNLNNLALWTAEFGVLNENNSLKAYGAAIVASPSEINNLIEDKIPIKDLLGISNPSFNFDTLQDELYSTKSFDEVISFMTDTLNSKLKTAV